MASNKPEPRAVFNVRSYGATGDGSTDDRAAIQRAIDACAAFGATNQKGGVVYFPAGNYIVFAPLVLPRTGSTPTQVVHLEGENVRASSIFPLGISAFSGHGTVEWAATTSLTYHQSIRHLTIFAATYADARAIYYKANATISGVAAAEAEWLQLHLDNVMVQGNNDYTQALIDLEVGVRNSTWRQVFGDVSPGSSQTYSTILLKVPYQYSDASDPAAGIDSIGAGYCQFTNVSPKLSAGGWVRSFEGRMYVSSWNTGFSNGMRSGHTGADYDFYNSFQLTLNNLAAEGNGGQPIHRFTRCENVNILNVGAPPGDPTDSAWVAAHAYALGDRVASTLLVSGGGTPLTKKYATCTTAGTSHAVTEPTWSNTGGATVSDGTVTWTMSTASAVGNSIELVDSKQVTIDGRFVTAGNPKCSGRLTKAISIDANCKECVVRNFTIRGTTASSEVEVLAAASAGNVVTGTMISDAGVRSHYTVGPSTNVDTSGATLTALETEVNELKAVLRTAGIIGT